MGCDTSAGKQNRMTVANTENARRSGAASERMGVQVTFFDISSDRRALPPPPPHILLGSVADGFFSIRFCFYKQALWQLGGTKRNLSYQTTVPHSFLRKERMENELSHNTQYTHSHTNTLFGTVMNDIFPLSNLFLSNLFSMKNDNTHTNAENWSRVFFGTNWKKVQTNRRWW